MSSQIPGLHLHNFACQAATEIHYQLGIKALGMASIRADRGEATLSARGIESLLAS